MKIIVTAALPYSYSVPHLGNFTGSVLPADVYHRYLKMRNTDSIFICGSDQHGTPIELRAIREKRKPEELAKEMHEKIKDLFKRFECDFTYYGGTHSEKNRETVYEIFEALSANKFIGEVKESQAYCKFDKRFLTDRLIEGNCPYCKGTKARGDQCDTCGRLLTPSQIIDPHCNICGKKEIEFKEVKNLAILLDKLQDKIEEFVAESSKNNWSKNATNKSLSYIKEGLKPRDITRNMKWGFGVPRKGFEESSFYVWFDALIGYIGMTREWDAKKWEEYWKSDSTHLIQFMGKDNIEFHTTIWPGLLIGSKLGYVMPRTIRASEFLNSGDVKFSKSAGVGLDMQSAIGIMEADYWRFILMHLYPETADSEFSIAVAVEVVDKLMNGKIGNFIHRVLKIASDNRAYLGEIAKISVNEEKIRKIVSEYYECFERIKLREALHKILELADFGNELMSEEEPWKLVKLAKDDKEAAKKFNDLIGTLLVVGYLISLMLWPFTPKASEKALDYFGAKGKPEIAAIEDVIERGMKIGLKKEFAPLFTRLSDEQIKKLESCR